MVGLEFEREVRVEGGEIFRSEASSRLGRKGSSVTIELQMGLYDQTPTSGARCYSVWKPNAGLILNL